MKKKMTVGFVTCWYKNISMANYSYNLITNLRRFSFLDVKVISSPCQCFGKYPNVKDAFEDGKIELINFPPYVVLKADNGVGWAINEVLQPFLQILRGLFFLSKSKKCAIVHYQQSSPYSFGIFPLIPLILIPTSNKKIVTVHSLHKLDM